MSDDDEDVVDPTKGDHVESLGDWGEFEAEDRPSIRVPETTTRSDPDDDAQDEDDQWRQHLISKSWEKLEAKRNPGDLVSQLCSASSCSSLMVVLDRIRENGWKTDLVAAVLRLVRSNDAEKVAAIVQACALEKFGFNDKSESCC